MTLVKAGLTPIKGLYREEYEDAKYFSLHDGPVSLALGDHFDMFDLTYQEWEELDTDIEEFVLPEEYMM